MNNNQTHLNLVQKALQSNDLENFVDALELMHLTAIIKSGGPFTVFAPINVAFLDIPEKVAQMIESENNILGSILQYHIVPGHFSSALLFRLGRLKSLIGENLQISIQDQGLCVNHAKVLRPDLLASNGIIHVIDRMLLPKSLDSNLVQSELVNI